MKALLKGSYLTVLWLACWLIAPPLAAQQEEITYYHNDALGSPVVATDINGGVKWKEEYSPYGSRLLHESRETTCPGIGCSPLESIWDEKQWFTGQLEETRVGTQYFGARWYEPEIGRFLSVDPVQFNEANLFSFNRYAYANNNPYRYTDPNGESPIDVVFLAVDVGRLAAAVYDGNAAAVQSAAVDVAFSIGGVLSPVPGLGQAAKIARATDKAADLNRVAKSSTIKSASEGIDVTKGAKVSGGKGGSGGGRQKNFFKELSDADGRPHTVYRRNSQNDRIENYETFDRSGAAGGNKRFRGTGKTHGGVEPPLVVEPKPGHPGGRPVRARPARKDETPRGF